MKGARQPTFTEIANGRYQVLAELGAGGMGVVYKARDRNLDSDVVVKLPHRAILENPTATARFAREIRSLVKLSHKHIVRITDAGIQDGVPYAVMAFLAGGSLQDRRTHKPDGTFVPQPPNSLPAWLPAVAEALDYVHAQGFLHRDVKPSNVLFDSEGSAYLSDFGVIKGLSSGSTNVTHVTAIGTILGTPAYLAPELIMGVRVDGRADQYGLAATVYDVLAGRPPFDGPNPAAVLAQHTSLPLPSLAKVNPAIPAALAAAVERGLAKNPAHRYPNCVAFAQAVLAGASGVGNATTLVPASASTPSHQLPQTSDYRRDPTIHYVAVKSPRREAAVRARSRLPYVLASVCAMLVLLVVLLAVALLSQMFPRTLGVAEDSKRESTVGRATEESRDTPREVIDTRPGSTPKETTSESKKPPLDEPKEPVGASASERQVEAILSAIRLPPIRPGSANEPIQVKSMPSFDGKTLAMYSLDRAETPLRQAVKNAQKVMQEEIGKKQLPQEFVKPVDVLAFQNQIRDIQAKDVAVLQAKLDEVLQELTEAEKNVRAAETSRGWLATTDYIKARLQFQIAYLYQYQSALAEMRKTLPPLDEKVHNGWRLVSVKTVDGDFMGRRMAKEGEKLFEKIIKEHPGTPWEVLARRDQLVELGLKWEGARVGSQP